MKVKKGVEVVPSIATLQHRYWVSYLGYGGKLPLWLLHLSLLVLCCVRHHHHRRGLTKFLNCSELVLQLLFVLLLQGPVRIVDYFIGWRRAWYAVDIVFYFGDDVICTLHSSLLMGRGLPLRTFHHLLVDPSFGPCTEMFLWQVPSHSWCISICCCVSVGGVGRLLWRQLLRLLTWKGCRLLELFLWCEVARLPEEELFIVFFLAFHVEGFYTKELLLLRAHVKLVFRIFDLIHL